MCPALQRCCWLWCVLLLIFSTSVLSTRHADRRRWDPGSLDDKVEEIIAGAKSAGVSARHWPCSCRRASTCCFREDVLLKMECALSLSLLERHRCSRIQSRKSIQCSRLWDTRVSGCWPRWSVKGHACAARV
eukprot:1798819-Rhodomonas_salina.1